MSTQSVNLDPQDKRLVSFDYDDWCANEGTTLISAALTPTATVTVVDDDVAGNVVTAMISASASGSLNCHAVFADGQEDDRTMTVTVRPK